MEKELIATYDLDPIECDYLECCSFEENSYKDLLSYILLIRDQYSLEYNQKNYDYFIKEYKEVKIKYNLKLRDLIMKHCPEYQGSMLHDFIVDFENRTLSIYLIKGGK